MGYAILWLRVRAEFMEGKIQTFLDVNLLKGDRKQLWVNPDCGLKTREWSQVPPAHSRLSTSCKPTQLSCCASQCICHLVLTCR